MAKKRKRGRPVADRKFDKRIGRVIRARRRRLGITSEAMCTAAGSSLAMLSRYETGKAKCAVDMLSRIARTLNCSVDDILTEAKIRHG